MVFILCYYAQFSHLTVSIPYGLIQLLLPPISIAHFTLFSSFYLFYTSCISSARSRPSQRYYGPWFQCYVEPCSTGKYPYVSTHNQSHMMSRWSPLHVAFQTALLCTLILLYLRTCVHNLMRMREIRLGGLLENRRCRYCLYTGASTNPTYLIGLLSGILGGRIWITVKNQALNGLGLKTSSFSCCVWRSGCLFFEVIAFVVDEDGFVYRLDNEEFRVLSGERRFAVFRRFPTRANFGDREMPHSYFCASVDFRSC